MLICAIEILNITIYVYKIYIIINKYKYKYELWYEITSYLAFLSH